MRTNPLRRLGTSDPGPDCRKSNHIVVSLQQEEVPVLCPHRSNHMRLYHTLGMRTHPLRRLGTSDPGPDCRKSYHMPVSLLQVVKELLGEELDLVAVWKEQVLVVCP